MSVSRSDALARIRDLVGARGVVDDASAKQKYLVDERRLYQGEAALIVRPESVEQVSAVVSICNAASIGVVPQGGNTGYCGGATPSDGDGQIVLSLERLNRVRELDATGFTMTVEAGVVLQHAQEHAQRAGLLFPLSMGSQGSCQIGGNLSTNAGGLAVLRYGTARELVLGLEVVLADGTIVSGLNGLRKDNTGFDLKSLFMGAEGTLGVITAAVLKLFPEPGSRETAWLACPDTDAVCRLLGLARRQSGDAVTTFEYVSRFSLDLVLRRVEGASDPLGAGGEHFVLLELSSGESAERLRETMEAILVQAMESGDVLDGTVAQSGAQRRQLWRLRESIPEAEKLDGGAVKHDVSVRISQIPRYLAQLRTRLAGAADARVSVYGHVGDGNLHVNLLAPDGCDPGKFRADHAQDLSAVVHSLAVEMGGSFSAEHGIGQLKRGTLLEHKDPAALALMRTVKHALDPNGIMNPGKVI